MARSVMVRRRRAAAAILLHCCISERQSKTAPRKCWVRKWLRRRSRLGAYNAVMSELLIEDRQVLRKFLRMTAADMEVILRRIGPDITKTDTNMRDAIPAKERLALTLRFLASGDSYKSMAYLFRIAPNTISKIIPEVCSAIYKHLKDEIKAPGTTGEWMIVADNYERLWNFPHCIGALDGKHCVINAPVNCGSFFFNYKGHHSIVLLALVDAMYRFIFVDIGCNGRVSDGGVFFDTPLARGLRNSTLKLPEPSRLAGRQERSPYVIIADDAFPLQVIIMKPFPFKSKEIVHRVFNYRLSRARCMVESAFGILATRFRILLRPMCLSPAKAQTVVEALVVLHNYLISRKECRRVYTPLGTIDSEDPQTGQVVSGTLYDLQPAGNRTGASARNAQREFAEYFTTPKGQVPWQYNYV